jgi:hypothetical protein
MVGNEMEPTGTESEEAQAAWQAPKQPEAPIKPFAERTPEEQQFHQENIKTPEMPPAVKNQIDILATAKNAGLNVEITKTQMMDQMQAEANAENATVDQARDITQNLLTSVINNSGRIRIEIDSLQVANKVLDFLGESSSAKKQDLASLVGTDKINLSAISGRNVFIERSGGAFSIGCY